MNTFINSLTVIRFIILTLFILQIYILPTITSAATNDDVLIGWKHSSLVIYGHARVAIPLPVQRLPGGSTPLYLQSYVGITVQDITSTTYFSNGTSPIKPVANWRNGYTTQLYVPPDMNSAVLVHIMPDIEDNPFNYIQNQYNVVPLQFSMFVNTASDNVTIVNSTMTVYLCRNIIYDTQNADYSICGPHNVPSILQVGNGTWINYLDQAMPTNGGRSNSVSFPIRRSIISGNPAPSIGFGVSNYDSSSSYITGSCNFGENQVVGTCLVTYGYLLTSINAGTFIDLVFIFTAFDSIIQYDVGFPSRLSIDYYPRVHFYGKGTSLKDIPFPPWMNLQILSTNPPSIYDYIRFNPESEGMGRYPTQPYVISDGTGTNAVNYEGVRMISVYRSPAVYGLRG